MSKQILLVAAFILAQVGIANACPTGLRKFETKDGMTKELGGKPACILEGTYFGAKALELDPAFSYILLGKVFIGQEERVVDPALNNPLKKDDAGNEIPVIPGKLVINPGVQIYALNPAKDETGVWDGILNADGVEISTLPDRDIKSFIAVSRDSKIEVKGLEGAPVLMTSAQGEWMNPKADKRAKAPGDWGGLIVNGYARTSKCYKDFASCNTPSEAGTGWYGGNNDRHNAGSIKYLQLEFGGDQIDDEKQLNGLTLNSVGVDTVVENVAILHNNDDCIEFFGGAVIAKNIFCYKQTDDGIDSTDGARVYIQNGVAVAQAFDDSAGAKNDRFIVEADSSKKPEQVAALRSHVALHNFTFIGNTNSQGFRFRRGTNYMIENSIMFDFDIKCWAPHASPFNMAEMNSNSFSGCNAADESAMAALGLNEFLNVGAFDTMAGTPWVLMTPVPGAKMYAPNSFQFLPAPTNPLEAYVVLKMKRAYQSVPTKGSFGGFEWVEIVEVE